MLLKDHRQRRQDEHEAQRIGQKRGFSGMSDTKDRADDQGEDRHRHAAAGEAPGDPPVDAPAEAMHRRAHRLGGGGIEQVAADRGGRVDAEEQDEQRRHQRAAADSRQANQHANDEAG